MHARRAALALLVVFALAACTDDDGGGTTTSAEATSTTIGATTSTSLPPISTPAEPTTDLADGRHPAHIIKVDAAKRTISVDVIQFLTGDAAAKAASEDGEESPPPNDYYIRNQNPRLRTLTVAPTATVTVNTLEGENTGDATQDVTVTLEKLGNYDGELLSTAVFWITLQGGTVTKIEQQYLP